MGTIVTGGGALCAIAWIRAVQSQLSASSSTAGRIPPSLTGSPPASGSVTSASAVVAAGGGSEPVVTGTVGRRSQVTTKRLSSVVITATAMITTGTPSEGASGPD